MRIAEPSARRAATSSAAVLSAAALAAVAAPAAPPVPPPASVAAAPAPAAAMGLETRITVRVKDAPISTFLDTVSAQAKVNFILSGDVQQKRITAFLQNVTVREALQLLLEIKGLACRQLGHSNTYVVAPKESGAAFAPIPASPHEDPMIVPVTVRVKEAPMSSLFDALSAQSNAGFILGSGVDGIRISVFLQDVTLREALDAVSEVKHVAYRRIGQTNIFAIEEATAAKK